MLEDGSSGYATLSMDESTDDGVGEDGEETSSGEADTGTGSTTGGEGTSTDDGEDTSDGDTAESETETTGEPEGCPASEPVELMQWHGDPWVAPSSGNAQVDFRLSEEKWKHYERFELDLDVDVGEVQTPYNCFLELRNVGAKQNESYPWRYFAVCAKNEAPRKLVHVVFAGENDYLTTNFTLEANTTYHVNVTFDSVLDESVLTMTKQGGEPVEIVSSPLNSSIVPMGQGLDLLVGFKTSHPDYPTIKPPWGWTFRNLEVTMDPGGPHGPLAPECQ